MHDIVSDLDEQVVEGRAVQQRLQDLKTNHPHQSKRNQRNENQSIFLRWTPLQSWLLSIYQKQTYRVHEAHVAVVDKSSWLDQGRSVGELVVV